MQITDPIGEHFRLTKIHKSALSRLDIETIEDLLFHFPFRYDSVDEHKSINNLQKGDKAIISGKLSGLKTRRAFRKKTPMAEGYIEDASGKVKLIWFHQPYIAKMVQDGAYVKLTGTVTGSEGKLYIANPQFGESKTEQYSASTDSLFASTEEGATFPIYPETKGITSRWFYHAIQRVFKEGALETLTETIPESILKTYNLPAIDTALVWIHTPKKQRDALAARKRFAFEEVFYIQLAQQKRKADYEHSKSFKINVDRGNIEKFLKRFPFEPTKAQHDAIHDVLTDFEAGHPMSRLLEGDVGSGKTAVAATTVYAVTTTRPEGRQAGNLQTAYMVPTEILAKQHFESFIEYFSHLPINIGLITSSGCKKFPSKIDPTKATDISRTQLLKWVANGEIPILIGTHALIQKTVQFQNLAYVIIDEQHRFGTIQRKTLARKDEVIPHLLSMTATPIPRTLALTIYGDLDLTVLDQMPKGRKPIITDVVDPNDRDKTYEKVKNELDAGRQVYVICPRIDEPDPNKALALYAKSVKEEAKRLSNDIFPNHTVETLYSKMKPGEKEEVMQRFAHGEVDILVATSVVEVGVNVPNATVIIIEGAERFGLAQLHQLRGRVIRSNHQAYCYVFTDAKSKHTKARLRALATAKNGFELAEEDLKLRGPGELTGRNQSGISDIGMEAIRNIKMVEVARKEAQNLVSEDPSLKRYPEIQKRVEAKTQSLHFE